MLYGSTVLIYISFILGLLFSPMTGGGWILFGVGLVIAILRQRTLWIFLRKGPSSWLWVLAGIVGLAASFYLQLRMPQASVNEVGRLSQQLNPDTPSLVQTVEGKVLSVPRLTRSGNSQLWLAADALIQQSNANWGQNIDPRKTTVSGKLYVTLPTAVASKLHPNQRIAIAGRLYAPRPVTNPAGFDFSHWLARQQSFTGMKGDQVEIRQDSNQWGLWKLRQRILDAQQAWVNDSVGPLMGAMVMGNQAVDLPFEVQDAFIQVGLAHALAASGFQISIILSVVLWLLRSLSNGTQFFGGSLALFLFLGLSGFQASVVRAVLMGLAGLIALVLGTKMKPVSMLIFIAFAMLVFNPLWIWDLGFQLSFLATLGLIVTVPPLQAALNWLPTNITALVAVPLAAMVWTLPLQFYSFGVFPTYALIANVVTTPLLTIVTLGSFISGVLGAIFPLLGSAAASIVSLPAQGLILMINGFNQLPGKTWAIGSISIGQLVVLYGLLGLIWLSPRWHKRWKLGLGLALLATFIPIWTHQINRSQLTLFDSGSTPILVMQQPRSTILINTGTEQDCLRTVIPFLQHQGINRIELAISTDQRKKSQAGWTVMTQRIRLGTFSPVSSTNPQDLQHKLLSIRRKIRWQPLQPDEFVRAEKAEVKVLRSSPPLLLFTLQNMHGLMITDRNTESLSPWLTEQPLPKIQLLWLTGDQWDINTLARLQPETIVVSNARVSPEAVQALKDIAKTVYWSDRDGAVQWEAKTGFRLALPLGDNQPKLL